MRNEFYGKTELYKSILHVVRQRQRLLIGALKSFENNKNRKV